ncbi:MAG: selenoprotein [Proteobacteria bacterium]|nr:MAG: selenoprotein [Pseudomonadota bacterium]
MTDRAAVSITYCTQCRWLLRAAWLAQELLGTFEADLTGVTLVPGRGGVFEVRVGDELVFSRRAAGRFPEAAELKRLVRDRVAPGRDLGHVDRAKAD